jgi:carboxyl-terminal processing protease
MSNRLLCLLLNDLQRPMRSTLNFWQSFCALSILSLCAPEARAKPGKQNGNGAEANFEALWQAFEKRYAFFQLRGVDWRKQYEVFRPKITKDTSDEQLFDLLCEMLAPLKDGHVNLKARGTFKGKFNPEEQPHFYKEFSSQRMIDDLFLLTEKNLREKGFGQAENDTRLFRHSESNQFGYLRILEFEGLSKKKANQALDRILAGFDGLDGLIVDIRDNPGGTDAMVYLIAGRFADKERIGHHRKTKKGPGEEDFSPIKTKTLKPLGKKQFTKPVVLLTNDASFSAADVFAMVMKELPHVRIIGDHTNGIFSNMFETKLPNGWRYTFSFQRYYSADMVCFEAKGIPVHEEVLNHKEDLIKGVDPVIRSALEDLFKRAKSN